jgi:hypothetical protein
METKGKERVRQSNERTKLPVIDDLGNCDFHGYNADTLMKETAKLRKIITKRGTLEILIPLCCTTTPVRYFEIQEYIERF